MAAVTYPASSAARFAANAVMDTVTDQDYKEPVQYIKKEPSRPCDMIPLK